jgi:polygalacturonase
MLGTHLMCVVLIVISCECSQSQETFYYSNEKIDSIISPFSMPQLSRPIIPSRSFNVAEFGAWEGGQIKNTGAIQRTIDSIAKLGGGSVIIPKGKWLTGAIHLDNNINLYLSKDAELLFSQDSSDYLPVVFSRHEDIECYKYSSFIYAEGKTNIAITGDGILNGQGKKWWGWKQSKKEVEILLNEMASKDVPVKDRIFDGTEGKQLR